MTTPYQRTPIGRARPLVVALCTVPLVGEALAAALEFAEVRTFTGQSDTAGLLFWLRPDVVIVDSEADALEVSAYALNRRLPLLHISVHEHFLRLFRHGEWEPIGDREGPTPEAIRNVVAGALFARREIVG